MHCGAVGHSNRVYLPAQRRGPHREAGREHVRLGPPRIVHGVVFVEGVRIADVRDAAENGYLPVQGDCAEARQRTRRQWRKFVPCREDVARDRELSP